MEIKDNIDSLEYYCKTIKWLRKEYENSIEEINCSNIWLFSNRLEKELDYTLDICINIINNSLFDHLPIEYKEEIWSFHEEIHKELDY